MIYTITLNPAIDHVFETKNFHPDKVNYYSNDYKVVSGKGINVAMMLNRLDVDVVVTGLLGSDNITLFNEKFKEMKLKQKFFEFSGPTRTNYKIVDLEGQKIIKVKGEQPVNDLDGAKLLDFLDRNLNSDDVVVVSGSVPRTITPMIYYQIGMIVNRNQALFILDSNDVWFKKALKTQPFLVKLNLEELCDVLKLDKDSVYPLTELKKMIYSLVKLGAQNVLLSLGQAGSLYYEKKSNTFYKIGTVSEMFFNSGVSDSMLAGFIYGFTNKLKLEDILKYATACALATVSNRDLGDHDEVEKFFPQISVRRLK